MITADPAKPAAMTGCRPRLIVQAGPSRTCADTDANDTAVILYTSGTTGKPKARSSRTPTPRDERLHVARSPRMTSADCHCGAPLSFLGQSVQMNAASGTALDGAAAASTRTRRCGGCSGNRSPSSAGQVRR